MRIPVRPLAVAALAATLAACSGGERAPLSDDLASDLRAASVELAPSAPRTAVVSAIESAPTPERKAPVARAPRKPAPRPTPRPATVATTADVEADGEVEAAVEAPVSTPEPAPAVGAGRPVPTPVPAATRRTGRIWTTADVIRNAPFPVNP